MDQPASETKGYSFHLVNIDCLPGSDHFNVVMVLEHSIVDLLPHIASSLPVCTYHHGSEVINLFEAGHIVAFYPQRVTITDVGNRSEAEALCRKYFQLIEEVGANRQRIPPVLHKRPPFSVLDILRALPQTNCGLCECPTCMAFAAKVVRREAGLEECPHVSPDGQWCQATAAASQPVDES